MTEQIVPIKSVPTSRFISSYGSVHAYQSDSDDDTFIDHFGITHTIKKGDYIVLLDSGKKIIKIEKYVFEHLYRS